MSCPVCQSPINPQLRMNKTYCSSICARLFLSAVKEANENNMNTKNNFKQPPYQPPIYQPQPEEKKFINKPSYQELLKQSQEKALSSIVTNKCTNEKCTNQISGNELYCEGCSENDTKCKKCGLNERNQPHPICTDCHKQMKEKPAHDRAQNKEKKEKSSKYDKKKK